MANYHVDPGSAHNFPVQKCGRKERIVTGNCSVRWRCPRSLGFGHDEGDLERFAFKHRKSGEITSPRNQLVPKERCRVDGRQMDLKGDGNRRSITSVLLQVLLQLLWQNMFPKFIIYSLMMSYVICFKYLKWSLVIIYLFQSGRSIEMLPNLRCRGRYASLRFVTWMQWKQFLSWIFVVGNDHKEVHTQSYTCNHTCAIIYIYIHIIFIYIYIYILYVIYIYIWYVYIIHYIFSYDI